MKLLVLLKPQALLSSAPFNTKTRQGGLTCKELKKTQRLVSHAQLKKNQGNSVDKHFLKQEKCKCVTCSKEHEKYIKCALYESLHIYEASGHRNKVHLNCCATKSFFLLFQRKPYK